MREGTSARLSCGADGNPAPRYTWLRVSDGGSVTVGETSDLVLVGSSMTVGQYVCEVRVGDNKITSDLATLSLYTRPHIEAVREQVGSIGETMTLSCKIESGLEDNTISWDMSGVPVRDDLEKYDIRVTDTGHEYISELVIKDADVDDFVSYSCHANNQMGYDSFTIHLKEKGQITYKMYQIKWTKLIFRWFK